MRAEGNCGNGELGQTVEEPRTALPHVERVEEVAWHHGATASATGIEAAKRRRAKDGQR